MKAAVLHEPAGMTSRPLRLEDIERPEPEEGEVLIHVDCCGVCRTDLHVVEGELPVRKSPVVPGHQIVGRIAAVGLSVAGLRIGDRVGAAWLNSTCGKCGFCTSGRENLCDEPEFTGWTRDGGFAEHAVVPAQFTYPLQERITPEHAAPLMCAGIIGYRALRLTGIKDWNGAKLGIYGFGAAGHVAIQLARYRGARVFVATRDRERHQALAEELGAAWVGDTFDVPAEKLDASIVFAPAGEIVPAALKGLDKGGTLVLGGIHMSPIPEFEYSLIYGERIVRSVANNTRQDGLEFLEEAAKAGVTTSVEVFGLEDANDALIALKTDAIKGAAVLKIS